MNATQLKSFRKSFGLSQEKLGQRIGVGKKTIMRWEAGDNIPEIRVKVLNELFDIATPTVKADLVQKIYPVKTYSQSEMARILDKNNHLLNKMFGIIDELKEEVAQLKCEVEAINIIKDPERVLDKN